jgi:HAD superfamily hydrolase (TIGR01509 family)
MFDFGLTLAYPPTFDELVRAAGRDLGRSDQEIDVFITAVNSVDEHPDVRAAEERRELSSDEHRAADMAYAIACDGDVELMAAFHDGYVQADTFVAYPDAQSTLEELRRGGLKLGVLSNCGWDVRRNLEHLGLAAYFDAFTLSCEHGMAKPDPALFTLSCERLGLPPTEVLMVGDNPTVDGGAASAGMPTLILPQVSPGAERGLGLVVALTR